MKKNLCVAVVGTGLLAFSLGTAHATFYDPCPDGKSCELSDSVSYITGQKPYGLKFNDSSDFVTETFSITPPFEPGIDTLRWAYFWVEIKDEYNGYEKLKLNTSTWNYTTGDIDDENGWDWSTYFSGNQGSGQLFADLAADGNITMTIKWAEGQFWLQEAGITAGICDNTAPVPEPATLLLFGTGLAGLAGIGRRRKSNLN